MSTASPWRTGGYHQNPGYPVLCAYMDEDYAAGLEI